MSQPTIPKGIQFKNVKPLGYQQEFRDYIVTPNQTYSNQFRTSDIVRIQFQLNDWFIDPYESYIEAEVQLANETTFNLEDNTGTGISYNSQDGSKVPKFYLMDGPSTCLINDYRLEVNSKEIERIREYDQLGQILSDINMYPDAVDQKDYEGYYSIKGGFYNQTLQPQSQQINYMKTNTTAVTTAGTSGAGLAYGFAAGNSIFHNGRRGSYEIDNKAILARTGRNGLGQAPQSMNLVTSTNIGSAAVGAMTETSTTVYWNGSPGGVPVTDGNYITAIKVDTGNSGLLCNMFGEGTYLNSLTLGNSNFGIIGSDSTTDNACLLVNPCQYSPKLSQIDGHNTILTNLPISKIVNGNCISDISNMYRANQSDNLTNTRQYLQIPLLSGVMGVLIPQERWQLIPSSSLGQVNMEFRFNPFAFISHDGSVPEWLVTKFQLRLRLYRFDESLQNQLKNTISSGVQLHSQIFSMGPTYNIQPSIPVTNSWQLNNGIPSIKQLFFWFIPNDFEIYRFCRKSFRISQNLTSMQLKIGSNYLPQIPIQGHAGNIVRNTKIKEDNSVFLSELHQALNMLFDCKKHININKLNFAINDRPYDVTQNSYCGQSSANMTAEVKRQMAQYGFLLHEELRCRGKALYAFNMEMDKKNDETMTGINTTVTRPIELIIKGDENYFPRGSTMYVMFLSDFVVTFNSNDTTTEGAG